MNTTYCHIEEFGDDRYNLLPIMAYCFNHSVIWAPNMEKLSIANKEGRSFFSPGDVLELIENGNIKVMAREPWYYKDERTRPNRFQSQGWLDGIDNRLRDYVIEDRDKPIQERRVIIAPDERGIEFAEKIIGSHKKKDIALIDFIRQQKKAGNLPRRIINRINVENFNEEESIKFILRSVYNNNDAFELSNAEIPTMSDHPDVFLKCMDYCGAGYQNGNETYSSERVFNLIDSLKTILSLNTSRLTPNKLKKLIIKGEKPNFIFDDFTKMMAADVVKDSKDLNVMLSVIASSINEDIREYEKNKPNIYDFVNIPSLLFGLFSFAVSVSVGGAINLGLGFFAALPSIVKIVYPVPSQPHMHLPYLFAYGTAKTNYKKMKELYKAINEEISK